MRVDADPNSPDYWARDFIRAPTVKLDGKVLDYVRWADDSTGLVNVYLYDGNQPVIEDNHLVHQTLSGRVTFEFEDSDLRPYPLR